jgi:vacuolar-type H+-ATPase subunit F/Vma7
MSGFAYVGDERDGAGFRLAGVRCWAPADDPAGDFRAALASGVDAVFVAAATAERLPPAELDAALAVGRPLVVLLPQPGAPPSRRDPAERVRAQLGLDA